MTHVFHAKKEARIKMTNEGHFGGLAGRAYIIEYQKCGLPHVHMLIFLEEGDKIRFVEQIDAFISAQIPDIEVHPQLYAAVSKYMLHGPCTPERCMENNVCKKHFPKAFTEQTVIKEDGYPDYAHSQNGHTIEQNGIVFDNHYVVPHPRELLVKFDCHINLEVCASIKAVKYIHKYIYKGPDCATAIQTDGPQDEIRSYLDARYISSTQACHNIFEFPMHMEYPAVYQLPVHLPGQNTVTFNPEDQIEDVVNNTKDTPLLGWFKANANPILMEAGANNHLHQDFPKGFVWNKSRGVWTIRQ